MEPYRHSSQLNYITEELTSNLKLIVYSTVFDLTRLTNRNYCNFAVILFLRLHNKELVVFYGFFLSLEAKWSAHSPLFSLFFPIVKESTGQFNERGVFSLVVGECISGKESSTQVIRFPRLP